MALESLDSKGLPNQVVLAGGGMEGTTVVSGEHGRESAGSVGTVGLNGIRDRGKMAEVR